MPRRGGAGELGYLTSSGNVMIDTLRVVDGNSTGVAAGELGGGGESTVRTVLEELLARLPAEFGLVEMGTRASPMQRTASAPFVALVLQVRLAALRVSWLAAASINFAFRCRNVRG